MAKLIKRDERSAQDTGDSGGSGAQRADIVTHEVVDARSEAQQIRDSAKEAADKVRADAQTEAEALLEDARKQADTLREEAKAEGYKDGREAGLKELVTATLEANHRADAILQEIVPQLSSLAMRIARRILGRELEFHPEMVVEIVKHALGDKARARREITLRVHPSDAQMIRDSKHELVEMLSRTKDIAIREDDKVAQHGVIIETDAGIIDAQLETQLSTFEQLLRQLS